MFRRLIDAARVLAALPRIELARQIEGPAPLLWRLRREGMRRSPRSNSGRGRLQETILAIDRRFPGGANCYRRALLEIALDPDAAKQPFFMGINSSCEPNSGHAWIGSVNGSTDRYHVVISM